MFLATATILEETTLFEKLRAPSSKFMHSKSISSKMVPLISQKVWFLQVWSPSQETRIGYRSKKETPRAHRGQMRHFTDILLHKGPFWSPLLLLAGEASPRPPQTPHPDPQCRYPDWDWAQVSPAQETNREEEMVPRMPFPNPLTRA